MGVHSGWDSFLLKYGGEAFLTKYLLYDFLLRYGGEVCLERRSMFSIVNIGLL